jgi:hypothetical protein
MDQKTKYIETPKAHFLQEMRRHLLRRPTIQSEARIIRAPALLRKERKG